MALSTTSITNMALDRIGAARITDYETSSEPMAIKAKTHYEQVRDSLLQSCPWRFAVARATLSEDTTAPSFEYDNQFILPVDFLGLVELYGSDSDFMLEGDRLLTDDSTAKIKYIKKVTDPAKFEPLFVEVLVLALAMRFSMGVSQSPKMHEGIYAELRQTMSRVRQLVKQQTNTKASHGTWIQARLSRGVVDPSRVESY